MNVNVPDLHDDCSATAAQNHQCAEDKARNNQVAFYKDPGTGAFTHPVVYIERGGHEFWPVPIWSFLGAQKHGGDDLEHQYLTSPPPNLGEVEHPLSEDPAAMAILQFNGRWGDVQPRTRPSVPADEPAAGATAALRVDVAGRQLDPLAAEGDRVLESARRHGTRRGDAHGLV